MKNKISFKGASLISFVQVRLNAYDLILLDMYVIAAQCSESKRLELRIILYELRFALEWHIKKPAFHALHL